MINYGTIISSTSVAIDFEELDDNMTWEEFSKNSKNYFIYSKDCDSIWRIY